MSKRILAIGDIHGCMRQLDALLEAISLTTDDHLILLGDLIDRGEDSAGVLRRVIRLSGTHHVTVVKGNHEEMMLGARKSVEKFANWVINGGDATLRSYNGARARLIDVPPEHLAFLEGSLVDYHETDSHIFVHANAYPDMAMAEQPEYMLRWERCDNIAAHESGKIIVCGHTPQRSGKVLNVGHAVCLDTYAYGGGPLSCLDVGSGRIWQADPTGRVARLHLSEFENQ